MCVNFESWPGELFVSIMLHLSIWSRPFCKLGASLEYHPIIWVVCCLERLKNSIRSTLWTTCKARRGGGEAFTPHSGWIGVDDWVWWVGMKQHPITNRYNEKRTARQMYVFVASWSGCRNVNNGQLWRLIWLTSRRSAALLYHLCWWGQINHQRRRGFRGAVLFPSRVSEYPTMIILCV